jgi:hypothetical protein
MMAWADGPVGHGNVGYTERRCLAGKTLKVFNRGLDSIRQNAHDDNGNQLAAWFRKPLGWTLAKIVSKWT